jgi:predicted enzyme related to lactoylglutathione lyase
MSGHGSVCNFSVECDDVERAKAFYEAVFGWRITPWGPPGYYRIATGKPGEPGMVGDLRARREPLSGTGSPSYECTMQVDSIAEAIVAIEANGGRMVTGRYRIDGVGELAYFQDTEGNRAAVMQHDPGVDPWAP